MLPALRRLCEAALKDQTNAVNVLGFYTASKRFRAADLQDYCYRFILKHFAAIAQSPNFEASPFRSDTNYVTSHHCNINGQKTKIIY